MLLFFSIKKFHSSLTNNLPFLELCVEYPDEILEILVRQVASILDSIEALSAPHQNILTVRLTDVAYSNNRVQLFLIALVIITKINGRAAHFLFK
jgi:hypothetical protein